MDTTTLLGRRSGRRRLLTAAVIVVCLITFFANNRVLVPDIMESRNIITAREMVYDGHWMVPTMNGELRLEKPPLPTWLTAVAEIIAPDSLAWQRGMAGLAALLLVFYFWRFSRRVLRLDPIIPTLLLCTGYNVILMGRTASWDIYCHAFMMGGIYHLAVALRGQGPMWRHFAAAGVFTGLSIMSKGPVSLYALFLPFVIGYGWCFRPQMKGKGRALALMLLTALVIGTWWYAYVYLTQTDVFEAVAQKESGSWINRNVRPWYYYWKFFLESGVWSLLLLTAIFLPWASASRRKSRGWLFALLWMTASLVLLSLMPEKKSRYLLPLLIPGSYVMGWLLAWWQQAFAALHTGSRHTSDQSPAQCAQTDIAERNNRHRPAGPPTAHNGIIPTAGPDNHRRAMEGSPARKETVAAAGRNNRQQAGEQSELPAGTPDCAVCDDRQQPVEAAGAECAGRRRSGDRCFYDVSLPPKILRLDVLAFRVNAALIALIVALLPVAAWWFVCRPGHVTPAFWLVFTLCCEVLAVYLFSAVRRLRPMRLLWGVTMLFVAAECLVMPALKPLINNPDMQSVALTREMEPLHALPFYHLESEPLRIELVYAAGRKIRPLDAGHPDSLRARLPLVILTHGRVGEVLPAGLWADTDTLYIGRFDDNRRPRSTRFYSDIFIYHLTLLRAKPAAVPAGSLSSGTSGHHAAAGVPVRTSLFSN